jgi:hypothetical protein
MPRGAPQGNQYAKKAESNQGITFSYYLDAYEYEFLQKSVEYDGKEPTDKNVRAKAKALTKDALTSEMQRVFLRYKREKETRQ